MMNTLSTLERKVRSAQDLKQVVRTMKSLAAINIRPYERAVQALAEYYRTIELGLLATFRPSHNFYGIRDKATSTGSAGLIIFGSDQGLAGQFNETMATFLSEKISANEGKIIIWPVGERLYDQLLEVKLLPKLPYRVPDSVDGIVPLISQLLLELEQETEEHGWQETFVFHNRPQSVSLYEPTYFRMLPLDETWVSELNKRRWPTRKIPEIFLPQEKTRAALVREYLFVSLFRACAQSLAAENMSRLAAMQRAEKNINDSLEKLQLQFNQLRQNTIDEQLFDIIAGFEALSAGNH